MRSPSLLIRFLQRYAWVHHIRKSWSYFEVGSEVNVLRVCLLGLWLWQGNQITGSFRRRKGGVLNFQNVVFWTSRVENLQKMSLEYEASAVAFFSTQDRTVLVVGSLSREFREEPNELAWYHYTLRITIFWSFSDVCLTWVSGKIRTKFLTWGPSIGEEDSAQMSSSVRVGSLILLRVYTKSL